MAKPNCGVRCEIGGLSPGITATSTIRATRIIVTAGILKCGTVVTLNAALTAVSETSPRLKRLLRVFARSTKCTVVVVQCGYASLVVVRIATESPIDVILERARRARWGRPRSLGFA